MTANKLPRREPQQDHWSVPTFALLVVLAGVVPGGVEAGSDFNCDGFEDLAIGSPQEDTSGVHWAGSVHVLYSGVLGLSADNNEIWSQDVHGVPGEASFRDHLGGALAGGDFDGNGCDDLVIGVASDEIEGFGGGAVNVVYGSVYGLTTLDIVPSSQLWHQDSPGVPDVRESGDAFGEAIAVGDFDGDGFEDLAIGVGGESNPYFQSGAVNVLYGSALGLTSLGSDFLDQDTSGVPDTGRAREHFGSAVAVGDFDNDGFDDLAIGAPGESLGEENDEREAAGAVTVLHGSPAGIATGLTQHWTQDTPGVQGVAESDDSFGSAFAVGDFNADGFADLAIGVPYEDIEDTEYAEDAGAVNVLYGSPAGLTVEGNQIWTQHTYGVEGLPEPDEYLGYKLASGDFDGDGFGDLAISAPGESPDVFESSGAVHVLYGSTDGLTALGHKDQFLHQNSPEVQDYSEYADYLGLGLTVGDFDNDGYSDVAIGTPRETIDEVDTGAVNVLYGSPVGLTGIRDQFWHPNSPGILGTADGGERFGSGL